jgi:hypothetical protein
MKLLIMQSSSASRHFILGRNILLSTLFTNTLNLCSSFSVRYQISQYKTTGKIIILYVLVIYQLPCYV